MITATVTAKGQITIPSEVRQALKLESGDRITFEETTPGCFAFKPARKISVTVLKGMFGKHGKTVSITEMNAIIARRGSSPK